MKPARRSVLVATTAVASLLALAAPAGASAACSIAPASWVGGTTNLCHGTVVYNDYVYDDYGADTGAIATSSNSAGLAPTSGDQSYPTGLMNTADALRLTLRIEDGRVLVQALMNTMYHGGDTTLAVAISTDEHWVNGPLKQWGGLDVSSRGWDELAQFTSGDPKTHLITGSMPLPSGHRWRIQAATAIASSGKVMNVAFRGPDEGASYVLTSTGSDNGSWFEDKQAAALGAGDISSFGYAVSAAEMRHGATQPMRVGPGLHERVYTSRYTIPPGQGVDVKGVPGRGTGGKAGTGAQSFQYLGRHQPYGIYIPDHAGPYGMQMLFHGSSSSLSGLVNQPGMEAQVGDALNRVLVVPEARGQQGYGSDISERDLLDAMADVEAHYPIDRNRVFAGGYSQGGYITYRMAELYPQLFAGALDWVGWPGDEADGTPLQGQNVGTAGSVGDTLDLVNNMRWIPTVMTYSGADELVPIQTGLGVYRTFAASANPFLFLLFPAAEHLTHALLDQWTAQAEYSKDLTLVHNPPLVTYRTSTYLDDAAVGVVHDQAYWVSAIRPVSSAYADVSLETHACGGSIPTLKSTTGAGTQVLPYVSLGQAVTGSTPIAKARLLTGTLSKVSSLAIDSAATCLRGGSFNYDITTDGPVTIRLSDGRVLRLAGSGEHTGTL